MTTAPPTSSPPALPAATPAATSPAATQAATIAAAPPADQKRALVIMAHPDDIEFTCGGTVANLADDGWRVSFCLVTSGDKGSKDDTLIAWDLGRMREAEQEAASKRLGVSECLFLRWPDGFVEDSSELRAALVRVIRSQQPDLLITWDGYRGFNHRDHRTVGLVALDAAFPLARTPHYFPQHADEGLGPHRVNTVLLAGSREPDYFVDVGRQLDRKISALLCHASQVQATREELSQRMRKRQSEAAAQGRIPWAEGFRRMSFGGTGAPSRTAALRAQAKNRDAGPEQSDMASTAQQPGAANHPPDRKET